MSWVFIFITGSVWTIYLTIATYWFKATNTIKARLFSVTNQFIIITASIWCTLLFTSVAYTSCKLHVAKERWIVVVMPDAKWWPRKYSIFISVYWNTVSVIYIFFVKILTATPWNDEECHFLHLLELLFQLQRMTLKLELAILVRVYITGCLVKYSFMWQVKWIFSLNTDI